MLITLSPGPMIIKVIDGGWFENSTLQMIQKNQILSVPLPETLSLTENITLNPNEIQQPLGISIMIESSPHARQWSERKTISCTYAGTCLTTVPMGEYTAPGLGYRLDCEGSQEVQIHYSQLGKIARVHLFDEHQKVHARFTSDPISSPDELTETGRTALTECH
jgi:hypothetical protein